MAEQYAAANGLVLDAELTFHDLGVSAYRGRNAEHGQLGSFLRAVDDGLVAAGSYLLVEAMDRLTRQNLFGAVALFEQIIRRGIKLVTLRDRVVYTEEAIDNNPMMLMPAVVMLMLANQESHQKGVRLRASWTARRAKAREDGTPLTSRTPGWLRLDKETNSYFIIKERAGVVRRIFDMVAEGKGIKHITETLNREKVPTFGTAQFWHRYCVSKIADNPAANGTLVSHVIEEKRNGNGEKKKVRRALDTAKANYYPAVVPKELFNKVVAMRERKSPSTRNSELKSMLAGLAVCPLCGGSVTRIGKGSTTRRRGSSHYLLCMRAKLSAGCKAKSIRQQDVENAIIRVMPMEPPDPMSSDDVDELFQSVSRENERLNTVIVNLIEQATMGASTAISEKLAEEQKKKTRVEETLADLSRNHSPLMQKATMKALVELGKLVKAEPLDINRINAAMRVAFHRVEVDTENRSLYFHWRGTPTGEMMWIDELDDNYSMSKRNPVAKKLRTPPTSRVS